MSGQSINGPKRSHKELIEENERLRAKAQEAIEFAKKVQDELNYVRAQIRLRELLGVDRNTASFIQALDPQCLRHTHH